MWGQKHKPQYQDRGWGGGIQVDGSTMRLSDSNSGTNLNI